MKWCSLSWTLGADEHPQARCTDWNNSTDNLVLRSDVFSLIHKRLAGLGISGGATYDGLVALAALEHDAVLATRDARALATYDAIGVIVELIED